MGKTNLLYGALGLLAIGMTACSSDDIPGNGVAQQDEHRYLRVNLVNPSMTRAEDFEAGTEVENKVESIIMDFYDVAGNHVARANPADIEWESNNGNHNVGKIGSAIVKIGLNKDQNLPAYVMCYLNPVEWGNAKETETSNMTDLRNHKRKAYKDAKNCFAMNNSCYYGPDGVTGQANVKISGTPIATTSLYTSKEDADKDNAATVDIYVERYAAKVNFTVKTQDYDNGIGIEAYNGKTGKIDFSLKFTPERWTVNADAPEMFAVKNFTTVEGAGVPTMNEVQDYLGTWNSWNDAANHRSYWSCSPAFFAKEFPQVSDQIVEAAGEGKTGAGEKVGPYALKYYSYNQILDDNIGNKNLVADQDGTLPVKYALENTMGKPAFSSLNPKAAVPSVLLVGHYDVTYNGNAIPENTSFYIFNNSLYFKETPQGVDNAVLMKDHFISQQEILFVADPENGHTLLTSGNAGSALNYLVVEHPDKDVRGQNLVPHRFVTLQLSDVPTGVYFRPNGAGEYVAVTAENLNVVNTLLWQQSGVAYAYTDGKCYYSMPIHHLGMTENTTGIPLEEDGDIDWKNLRVGDMGLVRNHVYKLSVDAIKGLATGIENLDYPIVPPMDQDEYYIKYRINILNWRVVPAQGGIIL